VVEQAKDGLLEVWLGQIALEGWARQTLLSGRLGPMLVRALKTGIAHRA
jgi:hypothetical protein